MIFDRGVLRFELAIISDTNPGTNLSNMANESYMYPGLEETRRAHNLNLLDFQEQHHVHGVPSATFDCYYYLAKALCMLSNNLFSHRRLTLGKIGDVFEDLFNRVPRPVLRKVLENDIPTTKAAWEALVYLAWRAERKDMFLFLMAVGAHHPQWVLENGYSYHVFAAFMDCPDVIQNLLEIGARPYRSKCKYPYSMYRRPPIIEAALSGSLQCVQLLIDSCDANQLQQLGIEDGFETYVLALENKLFITKHEFQRMKRVTLDNEVHNRILDLLLKNGANVDAPYKHLVDHKILIQMFYSSEKIVRTWHLTLLEFTVYSKLAIFHRLLPYSTRPSQEITRIGVYIAAESGSDTLRDYLGSRTAQGLTETIRFLEIVLVEQFLCNGSEIDSTIVQALVENGVDVTLSSLRTGVYDLLCGLVFQARERGFNNHTTYCLKLLLRQGAVINSNVLRLAVCNRGSSSLQSLFELGVDLKEKASLALCTAARFGNYEAVSWLLTAGVDINSKLIVRDRQLNIISAAASRFISDIDIRSTLVPIPITFSASCGMLEYLLSMGAKLSVPQGSISSDIARDILTSTGPGRNETLKKAQLFIGLWLDPHQVPCSWAFQNTYGDYIDSCSSVRRHELLELEVFEFLFRSGCPVIPSSSLTDLIQRGGKSSLIRQVLDAGADINEYSQLCYPYCVRLAPIQAAAYRGNQELVSSLLQRGADIHQVAHKHRGRTALQAACEMKPENPTDELCKMRLLKFFIEHSVDVNEPPADKAGSTALGALAKCGEIENAALIIARGADINACFNSHYQIGLHGNRCRPLDAAASSGRLDMIQFLLNAGAFSACMGSTGYDGAITLAERRGYCAAADLIRQKVAEVNLLGRNPHIDKNQEIEDAVWSWPDD